MIINEFVYKIREKLQLEGGNGVQSHRVEEDYSVTVISGHTVTWTLTNDNEIKIESVSCHKGKHTGIECLCDSR